MFMGDVGALALGGALGTVAVIVRQEIVLFIMGGIFVAETLSVMLQVTWFKFTKRRFGEGRRLFKMAPLHHHFELSWLEGNAGGRALLDHHIDVVSVRIVHAQAALSRYGSSKVDDVRREASWIGKSRWCSCWDWVNPASRWRAGARGTAARLRVADTREVPPNLCRTGSARRRRCVCRRPVFAGAAGRRRGDRRDQPAVCRRSPPTCCR